MGIIDRAILAVAPGWARRRARDRTWVSYYEAAQPSIARPSRRETGNGNAAVSRAGRALREQARHLEQNHDLARGVLDVLVRNTVGIGIGVEPQPRMAGEKAEINDLLAWQLSQIWRDFCRRPEVTWQHDMGSAERMLARTWFRDGEVLAQLVSGTNLRIDHGTQVPFSFEMLEPDLMPLDQMRPASGDAAAITMGVETNAWNRPVAYWLYKRHPGDLMHLPGPSELKRLPADRVLHLKAADRIGQLRGVSVFASVLSRLEDIKDYEESERVAAKVAASMAAMIVKGSPEEYAAPSGSDAARQMRFRAGMVFDDLRPGERVETIDTKRPNPNALIWRQGQLRAVASGTGTSYSSAAKDYHGTYSAQRQELVEQYGGYQILAGEFISRMTRPIYEQVVQMAVLSRLIRLPDGLDIATVADAVYIPPQMPWIDPKKEAEAWAQLEDRAYVSGAEIVRRRGGNPHDVIDQQAAWLRAKKEAGVPSVGAKANEDRAEKDDEDDSRRVADDAFAQARRVDELRSEIMALTTRGEAQKAADKSVEMTTAILALLARDPAAPVVNVSAPIVNVDAKQDPPIVNVAAPAAPVINVAPAEVHVSAPTVNVAAADVTVHPAPIVVQAAEAPKPWATETEITEFDSSGRAKKYRTRPTD